MAENDESTLQQTPETEKPLPAVDRKKRTFGRDLLAKLPQLGIAGWQGGDTLDVYKDMQGLVELDADAFLSPLEPLSEDRHGG